MQLDIHDERVVRIFGDVTDDNMLKAERDLLALDSKAEDPITIYITSPGGSVGSGWGFIDFLSLLRSPIYTVALGDIGSMAIPIFCMGTKRFVGGRSEFTFHLVNRKLDGWFGPLEMDAICRSMWLDVERYGDIVARACVGVGGTDQTVTPEVVLEWQKDQRIIAPGEALLLGLAHFLIA